MTALIGNLIKHIITEIINETMTTGLFVSSCLFFIINIPNSKLIRHENTFLFILIPVRSTKRHRTNNAIHTMVVAYCALLNALSTTG